MAENCKNEKEILEQDMNSEELVNEFDGKDGTAPINTEEITSVKDAPRGEVIPNEHASPKDGTNTFQDVDDSARGNENIENVQSITYDTRESQADDIPSADVTNPDDKFAGDDNIKETGDNASGAVKLGDSEFGNGNGIQCQAEPGDIPHGDEIIHGDGECYTKSDSKSGVFRGILVTFRTETFPSGNVSALREITCMHHMNVREKDTKRSTNSPHTSDESCHSTPVLPKATVSQAVVDIPQSPRTELYPTQTFAEEIRNGHENDEGNATIVKNSGSCQIAHAQQDKTFADDDSDNGELEVAEVNRELEEDYDYDDTYFDELYDDDDLSSNLEVSHGSDLPLSLSSDELVYPRVYNPRPHSPSEDSRETEAHLPGAEIQPSDLPPRDSAPRLKRPRPGSRYRERAVTISQVKEGSDSAMTIPVEHVTEMDTTEIQTARGQGVQPASTGCARTVQTPSDSTGEGIVQTFMGLEQGRAMEIEIDNPCSAVPELRENSDGTYSCCRRLSSSVNTEAVAPCSESTTTSDVTVYKEDITKSRPQKKGRLRRGFDNIGQSLRRLGRRMIALATCCCKTT